MISGIGSYPVFPKKTRCQRHGRWEQTCSIITFKHGGEGTTGHSPRHLRRKRWPGLSARGTAPDFSQESERSRQIWICPLRKTKHLPPRIGQAIEP